MEKPSAFMVWGGKSTAFQGVWWVLKWTIISGDMRHLPGATRGIGSHTRRGHVRTLELPEIPGRHHSDEPGCTIASPPSSGSQRWQSPVWGIQVNTCLVHDPEPSVL